MEIRFPERTTRVEIRSGGIRRGRWFSPDEGTASLFVFDSNTSGLAGALPPASIVLPSGEREKTLRNVESILAGALERGLSRDGRIVGVGGGVVCDMAALAASLYMRGCGLVLVPTTLLAMVDAAIGGKTGVDFGGYKNIVGPFYPADEVRIDTDFLSTLPDAAYRSGLAEVIKHALLGDAELYRLLREGRAGILARDNGLLPRMVARAIAGKKGYVERDLREQGVRAHLNLGHTFAHALETVTGYRGSHGDAVGWGIGRAMAYGERAGLTEPGYACEVRDLLLSYGFQLERPGVDSGRLADAMTRDKKKRGGAVRLVLQRTLGDTELQDADPRLLAEILA